MHHEIAEIALRSHVDGRRIQGAVLDIDRLRRPTNDDRRENTIDDIARNELDSPCSKHCT